MMGCGTAAINDPRCRQAIELSEGLALELGENVTEIAVCLFEQWPDWVPVDE